MGKNYFLIFFGAILVIVGILNMKGNLSSIHWYNYRNVSEADVPKYGKCIGTGSVIIGAAFIIAAVLEMMIQSEIFDYISLAGILIGSGIMVYGQIKYNKGFF